MANLKETNIWETGIYQLETSDPVMGGPNGIDNSQPRQLANRTLWLKTELASAVASIGSNKAAADQTYALKATTLTAGSGLTGGGTLGGNRVLSMGTPSKISATSTNVAVSDTHSHEIDKASTTVAGIVMLADVLNSTDKAKALTAAQGKVLADSLAALGGEAFKVRGDLGNLNLDGVIGDNYYGIWYKRTNIGAAPELNYPQQQAGVLFVLPTAYQGMQLYVPYMSSVLYVRNTVQDGSFTSWRIIGEVVDNLNSGSATAALSAAKGKAIKERLDAAGVGGKAPVANSSTGVNDMLADLPDTCQDYTLSGNYTNGPLGVEAKTYTGIINVSARMFAAGVSKVLTMRQPDGSVWQNVRNASAWLGWERIDALDAVKLTGSQTVAGIKTFAGLTDFSSGLRISTGTKSSWATLGMGVSDVYLHNHTSNKFLQLRDDGNLQYSNKRVVVNGDNDIYDTATTDTRNIVTVDADGTLKRLTRPTTLAGYGITDAAEQRALHTSNLDSITNPGLYGQGTNANATSARNYPVNEAGSLIVAGSAYGVQQLYMPFYRLDIWKRNQTSSGGWTAWQKINTAPAELSTAVSDIKNELLGGASSAFDTLKELQTALGNDSNFAATVTGELGKRLQTTALAAEIKNLVKRTNHNRTISGNRSGYTDQSMRVDGSVTVYPDGRIVQQFHIKSFKPIWFNDESAAIGFGNAGGRGPRIPITLWTAMPAEISSVQVTPIRAVSTTDSQTYSSEAAEWIAAWSLQSQGSNKGGVNIDINRFRGGEDERMDLLITVEGY